MNIKSTFRVIDDVNGSELYRLEADGPVPVFLPIPSCDDTIRVQDHDRDYRVHRIKHYYSYGGVSVTVLVVPI